MSCRPQRNREITYSAVDHRENETAGMLLPPGVVAVAVIRVCVNATWYDRMKQRAQRREVTVQSVSSNMAKWPPLWSLCALMRNPTANSAAQAGPPRTE